MTNNKGTEPDELSYSFNSGIIRKCEYFDLFISYKRDNGDDHGQKLAIELHDKLTKDGFKVWLDNEEIGFSNNFEQRIEEALLHSKKVACIISPAWVESPNCRFEVQKAIEFEKRIIPIHYQEFRKLLNDQKEKGLLTEKEWLRIDRPQEIDFSHPSKLKSGYDDLKSVCRLHDDITLQFNKNLSESYYWGKYNRPKSMLLSGSQLSKTKLLKPKCNSDEELPTFTELQNEFLEASERFVKTEVTDKRKVYLAFTKEEIEYASELNMELKLQGVTTYFDDDASTGSDSSGGFIEPILNCETVLDVEVTTFSDKNDTRLNFARANNKRIVKITNKNSTKKTLESQGEKNIHVWNDQLSIDGLVSYINGDKVYNSFHSKLLGKAYEWENNEKNESKLLTLKEAFFSQDWYKNAEKEALEPQPSLLMINYVERSVAHAETVRKRKTGLLWTAVLGGLLIIILGGVSWYFGNKAKKESKKLDSTIKLAKQQTKIADEAKIKADEAKIKADKAKVKTDLLQIKITNQNKKASKLKYEADKQKSLAEEQKVLATKQKAIADEQTTLAKEKAEELLKSKESLEESNKVLTQTKKKTNAAKLSLEAYDLIIDGNFSKAKQKADEAVKLYTEIEEDFETDILYNTYHSILNSNDSITDNAFKKKDKLPVNVVKLTHCHYVYEEQFNRYYNLIKKMGISLENVFAITTSTTTEIGAIGLKNGKIILYNTVSEKQTDTISIGKYRITSMDINKTGNQMIASSVNGKITIIPLNPKTGTRNSKKQLIRRAAFARIEEIHYIDDNTIRAIGGAIPNDNTITKTYMSYPATVKKLHEILNR